MNTMSRQQILRLHARLSNKRRLSRRQQVQLLVCGAVLHNQPLTAQRDHEVDR